VERRAARILREYFEAPGQRVEILIRSSQAQHVPCMIFFPENKIPISR
jgi:hypothetical protein